MSSPLDGAFWWKNRSLPLCLFNNGEFATEKWGQANHWSECLRFLVWSSRYSGRLRKSTLWIIFNFNQAVGLEWLPIVLEIRHASQNVISGLIELGLLPSGREGSGTFLSRPLWGLTLKQAVDGIISCYLLSVSFWGNKSLMCPVQLIPTTSVEVNGRQVVFFPSYLKSGRNTRSLRAPGAVGLSSKY